MRARISRKSRRGEKLAYIAKHMDGLKRFLDDGTIEMDNNVVERAIRPIALNRKNALFAGHDEGGRTWGRIASLIETCKLNAVEPFAYLKATLEAIADATPPLESMSSCLGTSKNQRDNAGRNRLPMNNECYSFFKAAGNETN